ncbi:MAG: imidazole glycerol phosphate synthase subunit HisH [Planctomycetaceae bacterium]|jgi:glutamine amidotransferase|nr:imidazole glycerol phosphate synthase subunit HisH [Planctomycetaceae bacterium]
MTTGSSLKQSGRLAIVDYKAGNLTSVQLALDTIGVTGTVTSDPDVIRNSGKVIFPGVGAAGAAMENLRRLGIDKALQDVVRCGKPLLGICVGMQVLFDHSEEDGGTKMLGFIPGRVVRFAPKDRRDKVPQIGWNSVEQKTDSSVFADIPNGSDFYFVHSYYPLPQNPEHVAAVTEYGNCTFASVIQYANIVASQFHPEKSGKFGLQLLANFCNR